MTDTDNIAGIGIDRAEGLQRARIKQVPHSKRTAGAGFFIHHTGDDDFLTNRVDQFKLPQQGKRVETAGDAGLVICCSTPDDVSSANFCREGRA